MTTVAAALVPVGREGFSAIGTRDFFSALHGPICTRCVGVPPAPPAGVATESSMAGAFQWKGLAALTAFPQGRSLVAVRRGVCKQALLTTVVAHGVTAQAQFIGNHAVTQVFPSQVLNLPFLL